MTDRMLSQGSYAPRGHAEKSAVVARRPSGDLRGGATVSSWGRAEAGKPHGGLVGIESHFAHAANLSMAARRDDAQSLREVLIGGPNEEGQDLPMLTNMPPRILRARRCAPYDKGSTEGEALFHGLPGGLNLQRRNRGAGDRNPRPLMVSDDTMGGAVDLKDIAAFAVLFGEGA